MAIILEFRTSKAEGERSRRRVSGSAEIVIFPGIRYEHRPERDTAREQLASVPIRDVLNLVD